MGKLQILLVALIVVILSSCQYNYNVNYDGKTVIKDIDGVTYSFSSTIKTKNVKLPTYNELKIENKIKFVGLGATIEKDLNETDFERKIDLSKSKNFQIDSVSFGVNDAKDKVELRYYLTVDRSKEMVTFTLEKENETWEIK